MIAAVRHPLIDILEREKAARVAAGQAAHAAEVDSVIDRVTHLLAGVDRLLQHEHATAPGRFDCADARRVAHLLADLTNGAFGAFQEAAA